MYLSAVFVWFCICVSDWEGLASLYANGNWYFAHVYTYTAYDIKYFTLRPNGKLYIYYFDESLPTMSFYIMHNYVILNAKF